MLLFLVETASNVAWQLEPKSRLALGRDDINHIVVDHRSLARRHAEIEVGVERASVRDSLLKPATYVGERKLDGRTADLLPGDTLRMGRTEWNLVASSGSALEKEGFEVRGVEPFSLDRTMNRLREGASRRAPHRIWTRGWRDIDGRPFPGLLGVEGGHFWTRVFFDYALGVPADGVEATAEPMSRREAAECVERILGRYSTADFGAIFYALREAFGSDFIVDLLIEHENYDPNFWDWCYPVEGVDRVRKILPRLRDAERVMAMACAASIPVEGARLAVRQNAGSHGVLMMAKARGVTAQDFLAIDEALNDYPTSEASRYCLERGDDRLVERLTRRVLSHGSSLSQMTLLAERPAVGVAGELLGRLRPRDVTPACARWFANAGAPGSASLLEGWSDGESRDTVLELLGMSTDDALRQLWPGLPDDLRSAFEERWGPFASELPELPREEWFRPMRRWSEIDRLEVAHYRKVEPKEVDLSMLPDVATRDGRRLPRPVIEGLLLELANYGPRKPLDRYAHGLFELPALLDPASAARVWRFIARADRSTCPVSEHYRPAWASVFLSGARLFDIFEVDGGYGPPVDAFTRSTDPAAAVLQWKWWEEYPYSLELGGAENAADAAKWLLKRLPRELPEAFLPTIGEWLETMALEGVEIPPRRWFDLIRGEWFRGVASCVLFRGTFRDAEITFRYDDAFLDIDDEELPRSPSRIRVAHPAEFSPDEDLRWSIILAEYELTQPFSQINSNLEKSGWREVEEFFGLPLDGRALGSGWALEGQDAERTIYSLRTERGSARISLFRGLLDTLDVSDADGNEVDLEGVDPVFLHRIARDFRECDYP